MNAFPITLNEISSAIQQVYETSKAGILWCGHRFKTEYAPAIADKLSACALGIIAFLKGVLQSGPTASFALAGSLIFFSVVSFQIADQKNYENSIFTKSIWKTLGLIAFIASTVMTHLGLIACF